MMPRRGCTMLTATGEAAAAGGAADAGSPSLQDAQVMSAAPAIERPASRVDLGIMVEAAPMDQRPPGTAGASSGSSEPDPRAVLAWRMEKTKGRMTNVATVAAARPPMTARPR